MPRASCLGARANHAEDKQNYSNYVWRETVSIAGVKMKYNGGSENRGSLETHNRRIMKAQMLTLALIVSERINAC